MSTVIKISNELADAARIRSKMEHRSISTQIEYWATIGKTAEENPNLPFSFIRDIVLALEEIKERETTEYVKADEFTPIKAEYS